MARPGTIRHPTTVPVDPCRNVEALPLLLTRSSGVKGFTIHAGSARQALTRPRLGANRGRDPS